MTVDNRWTLRASCLEADVDQFIICMPGSQEAADMNRYEIWEHNLSKFDETIGYYCETCPVKAQCAYEGNRTGDNVWSVRGGTYPLLFSLEPPAKPKKPSGANVNSNAWHEVDGVWVCKKSGHVRDETRVEFQPGKVGGKGTCIECKNEAHRERRKEGRK